MKTDHQELIVTRYLMNYRRLLIVVLLSHLSLAAGCGGDLNLGQVAGTVTLNGQPVEGAIVLFHPRQGGSPSAAKTDTSGNYVLRYTRHEDGAEIGEHSVQISTFTQGDPDGDPPVPAVPERIPPKYNRHTELTVEVKPGSNAIDFPLEFTELAAQSGRVAR
jgi:hypothetical protein